MKIPKEELIKRIIKRVLEKKGIVHTQEELSELIQENLERLDKEYKISPSRARRIALDIDEIETTVKTRKSKEEKPEKCPACGEELKMLHARNLAGEEVTVGFKCTKCEYSGDIEAYVPMKYEFRLVKK